MQICIKINDLLFAIPLRSNIRHKNAFWTDTSNGCGLDFSKTVILTDDNYIDKHRKPCIGRMNLMRFVVKSIRLSAN